MNKLDKPVWFDDHAALIDLAKNKRAVSYPDLQGEVANLLDGYTGYVAANGNAFNVPKVALPDKISKNLIKQYATPTKELPHIEKLREDKLRSCPMCGSPHLFVTLDHILPKAEYPEYAIFGPNLVQACHCNSKRGTALRGTKVGERILHPYFDDILDERLLSTRFADLGKVPRVSIRVLLADVHQHHAAVDFHLKRVVLRAGIERTMRERWSDLIRRPSLVISEFGKLLPTRQQIVDILTEELDLRDDEFQSKNSWRSIFTHGLLDEHVVDWLFANLNRPGRTPRDPLLT
jgi:hypothetical protein